MTELTTWVFLEAWYQQLYELSLSSSPLDINDPRDLPPESVYRFEPPSNRRPCLTFFVTTSLITLSPKCRNINLPSIAYAFRPQLRYRLTLRGRTLLRNPWAYGGRDSHPSSRYSCQQQLLCHLQWCSRSTFFGIHNVLLPR